MWNTEYRQKKLIHIATQIQYQRQRQKEKHKISVPQAHYQEIENPQNGKNIYHHLSIKILI